MGGVETGSMYVQYLQGIKPNVPAAAGTMFIEIYMSSKIIVSAQIWYMHVPRYFLGQTCIEIY